MKISENDQSWHASGVLVRDARSVKTPEPEQAPHRSKKNTKKWCKGKVGRPHVGKWRKWDEVRHHNTRWNTNSRILVCERCEKELEYCWSFMGRRCKAPNHDHSVPAIVDEGE